MRPLPLLILSMFGVLFLSGCGGEPAITVKDTQGRAVGEIRMEDPDNAAIVSTNGETRGRVRGTLVRGETGGRSGTVETKDGKVLLKDPDGNAIGSLEKGSECYGKSRALLGTIGGEETDIEAAGAACMLLLLPKE